MSDTNLFDADAPTKRKGRALAKTEPPLSLIETIGRLAADPSVDVQKMREIIAIVGESQFHAAMIEMGDELPRINRDGKIVLKGGGKPIRFASFENLNRQCKPILNKHNFAMTFQPDLPPSGQGIIVRCLLTHGRKGEPVFTRYCVVPVPASSASPAMNAQQAVGAAIAYAKRYGMIALLNIETEAPDDRDMDATKQTDQYDKPLTFTMTKQLLAAIEKNEVPGEVFKKYWLDPFGVTAVKDIPADQFDAAMDACAKWGDKMKEKAK